MIKVFVSFIAGLYIGLLISSLLAIIKRYEMVPTQLYDDLFDKYQSLLRDTYEAKNKEGDE